MKYALLKYLKSSIDQEWLHFYYFDFESNQLMKKENYANQKLYQLTQDKLAQISTIAVNKTQKPVVFIVETNPIKFIATFLAGIIAEVNIFLCDPTWQQREWQQVLNLVKPDLVYSDRTTEDLITKIGSTVKNHGDKQSNLSIPASIMIPTGGTSGKIRFAIHSWDTLSASVTGFRSYFNCEKINSCCTLPLHHVSGLMQFMRSFLTQGNLYICSYKLLATRQIDFPKQDYFISLVPTQLQFLIESIPDYLSHFKTVLLGGAPAKRSLLETAREYKIAIAFTYGMTETASGIVVLKPEDFLTGNNSIGRVLPHGKVKLNITSLQNNKAGNGIGKLPEIEWRESLPSNKVLDLPVNLKNEGINQADHNINQIGLIEINCTSLCLGYYPQLFAINQPFVTDDLGYFDHDGYLHLVGRNSHKIITGGENVFPLEVESIIYATKLVKDVCVIGIPDPKWGEAVTAIYIPLKSTTNLALIKQKISSQLAKYKLPKNWIAVDSISRNNRGKINYQELKAIAIRIMSKE